MNNFEGNKKCLAQQNDNDPCPGKGSGAANNETENISTLSTLTKNTSSSQPFQKLNPGQLPGLWSGFTKAQIPLNTAGQSGFGRVADGG